VLAACTPMQWANPMTGTAAPAPDLAQCSQAACQEAKRYATLLDGPAYGWHRRVLFAADPSYQSVQEYYHEQEFYDFCMRVKGYQLVPETSAAAPTP
jgi:hypothetical protein